MAYLQYIYLTLQCGAKGSSLSTKKHNGSFYVMSLSLLKRRGEKNYRTI